MSWRYHNGKKPIQFTDAMIPEGAYGFIYQMTIEIDGEFKYYIGKKNFYSNRKKRFGKKALAAMTDKRQKKYEMVKKLSYQNYYSSNEVIKQAHKDGINVDRHILKICYSKAELTYEEVKAQFKNEVLEDDKCLNSNILGKFYKKYNDR
jgi:hypothetical protein